MASTNNRPPWTQLSTEAELGLARSYMDGLTILTPLAQSRELGSRYFTQDTKSLWEVFELSPGAPAAMLVAQPGSVSSMSFTLPPPRVRIFNSLQNVTGTTRNGITIGCVGQIVVSLEDVPKQLLLDPTYRFQLELLRYLPKRSRTISGQGKVPMPQGFYHPSNWINGGNPTPQVAGTRYGYQTFPANATVNRQTEWPLSGMAEMARVTFTVADVFAPWFQHAKIDDAYGGSIETLLYWIGGKKRYSASGVWSYRQNPFLGVFKFRYSAYDAYNQRFIVGAHSEPVFVRPKKWPTRPHIAAGVAGTTEYPRSREVNRDRPENCVILVAGVGGRVNGRVPI